MCICFFLCVHMCVGVYIEIRRETAWYGHLITQGSVWARVCNCFYTQHRASDTR